MPAAARIVLVLAHFGHWYVSFPVYFGPPVLLAVYIKWNGRRMQRKERLEAQKRSPRHGSGER